MPLNSKLLHVWERKLCFSSFLLLSRIHVRRKKAAREVDPPIFAPPPKKNKQKRKNSPLYELYRSVVKRITFHGNTWSISGWFGYGGGQLRVWFELKTGVWFILRKPGQSQRRAEGRPDHPRTCNHLSVFRRDKLASLPIGGAAPQAVFHFYIDPGFNLISAPPRVHQGSMANPLPSVWRPILREHND